MFLIKEYKARGVEEEQKLEDDVSVNVKKSFGIFGMKYSGLTPSIDRDGVSGVIRAQWCSPPHNWLEVSCNRISITNMDWYMV